MDHVMDIVVHSITTINNSQKFKKMAKLNWTDQKNINLLTAEVKASPDNLTAAFKNAAQKLNVSEGCVSQAWYKVVKGQVNGFRTKSAKVNYINVKNTPRKTNSVGGPIHEVVVDSKIYDGMKIVTLKQYYTV